MGLAEASHQEGELGIVDVTRGRGLAVRGEAVPIEMADIAVTERFFGQASQCFVVDLIGAQLGAVVQQLAPFPRGEELAADRGVAGAARQLLGDVDAVGFLGVE